MLRQAQLWTLVAGGAVFLMILFGADLVGDMGLEGEVEGVPCPQVARQDDMNFRSRFNSENQMTNGSMIRSRSGDPSPDCRRIGGSFRCEAEGPTLVEVRFPNDAFIFELPPESRAVLTGDRQFAFCTLLPPEGIL